VHLESDKRFKEYLIDLPDKRRVHQEPTAAPKWKGCEICGNIDQKYGSWVRIPSYIMGVVDIVGSANSEAKKK